MYPLGTEVEHRLAVLVCRDWYSETDAGGVFLRSVGSVDGDVRSGIGCSGSVAHLLKEASFGIWQPLGTYGYLAAVFKQSRLELIGTCLRVCLWEVYPAPLLQCVVDTEGQVVLVLPCESHSERGRNAEGIGNAHRVGGRDGRLRVGI